MQFEKVFFPAVLKRFFSTTYNFIKINYFSKDLLLDKRNVNLPSLCASNTC